MKFVVSAAFLPPERLIELAPVADECGYEAMSLPDHVAYPETLDTPYPYTDDGQRRYDATSDFPDPWVTVGALAMLTKRIRFTNNAFVVPLRNPFLLAKQIATAARFSNGRVTLTMGVGWSRVEFELAGQLFERRGARADEMIDLMRKLWRGETVEGEGRFYRVPRMTMTPPFAAADIPIWTGGISEIALKRAARYDGWLTDLQTTSDILDSIGRIRAHRKALGRGESFDVMSMASDAFDADGYRRLEDGGVTHVLTNPWVMTHGFTDDLQKQIDGLRRFADAFVDR